MTSQLERLGRRLAALEEDFRRLSRSNNLGNSSFDGGSILQNANDGTPGSQFGGAYDGTNGVIPLTSPPPPTPEIADSEVTSIIGGIRVRWGGSWVGGITTVAPLGFSSVEVHVANNPNFSALLFDTFKTSITSPRGGEVTISLPPGTYYVRLICRTTAGRAGAPSDPMGPVDAKAIVKEDLGFDIADLAGNRIFRGSVEPTGTTDVPLLYGDLWLKTPDNVAYQFQPPDPGSWIIVQDQNIVQALNDAADAAGLAEQAGLTASDAHTLAQGASTSAANASAAAAAAQSAANLAQSTAANKVTVYRQTSAPTGGSYTVNDLWLDTDDSNKLYAWSGSAWVLSDDQRIASALTNASTAQITANAKTTLFAQTSAPSVAGRSTGDTWVDTDDSNKVYVWTGAAWTATLFGVAAISATARQLGAVTTYRQATAPTGTLIANDLWIDSDDNQLYSYSGSAWIASQDVGIQTALTNAANAQSTAAGKTTTFYAAVAPSTTGRTTGDLWVDTANGNRVSTWTAGAWTLTQFSAAALSATARQLGSITTYRQSAAPASGMIANDLWIDSDDNKLYIYAGGTWVASQDIGIQQALTAVALKTTTFYAAVAPATTGRTTGDLWVDTANGNRVSTWNGTAWTLTQFAAAALSATARQLGSVTTYRQATAPASGMIAFDLWIDSDDNQLYSYSGSAWVASQDVGIQTALTNAATAQSTANLKTTVYYQTTSPATTGRTVGDLWVDTGNGNRVSTWNGSAWVLTQFAAAALSATARQLGGVTTYRQSAAPASGMLAFDLWIDSDDNQLYSYSGSAWVASQDVGIQQALTNAGNAQTTANAKTTTYYQISAPPTTGRVTGDIWVDTDDGNKIYAWNGTAWTATLLASQALSATARQLGAITIFRQASAPVSGMIAGDYWIDSDDNQPYFYSAGAWVVSRDSAVNSALTNAATAQATADGKARIFYQISAPTGLVAGDVGDEWVDTDDKFVTYTWSGTAWVKNAISTSSFEPNALVVSTVAATGSVTAALLESILVLATTIIAGASGINGPHAKLSAGGLETFDIDPDGGLMATGGFGTGSDGLYFVDPTTKVAKASLDRSGAGAMQSLSVAGVDGDGDGEIDSGINFYGRELNDWMQDKAEGTIASAFYGNAANGLFASGITSRFGLGEISFLQEPGRQYMVVFTGLHVSSTVAGDRALLTIRFTTDGSTPTISNGQALASSFLHLPAAATGYTAAPIIGMGSFPAGSLVRALVTVERFTGSGTVSVLTYSSTDPYAAPFRFFAIDMGRDIPDTYIPNDGGGVRSGGSPSAVGKRTYVSTWGPSFVGAYFGDGSRRTDTPDLMQGYTSYYPVAGTEKSLVGFTNNAIAGETTKTVTAALSGATVQKVEAYLYCYHSNSNAGGNSSIGYHGNATLPATAPAATYGGFSNAYFTKGSGRWFTLPSSTFANWASGTYRGITVGPTGDYMRFYGTGPQRPILRITYTR